MHLTETISYGIGIKKIYELFLVFCLKKKLLKFLNKKNLIKSLNFINLFASDYSKHGCNKFEESIAIRIGGLRSTKTPAL